MYVFTYRVSSYSICHMKWLLSFKVIYDDNFIMQKREPQTRKQKAASKMISQPFVRCGKRETFYK